MLRRLKINRQNELLNDFGVNGKRFYKLLEHKITTNKSAITK